MDYQWYPGHMAKAKRQMQEDIKLIDLIIEVIDARIPYASRNPDIDELGKNKARLILLNKEDLADDAVTNRWIASMKEKGYYAVKIDSRNRNAMKQVLSVIMEATSEKRERDRKRGIKNRPVRAMIVGIPNVGKSTFINSFAKKAVAKTGNKPGVTKGKQWIRPSKDVELLDTPGILWPKFDDEKVGESLALVGSMNDQNLNLDELALTLIRFLCAQYPGTLRSRYEVEESAGEADILMEIAKNRNCLKNGGELDYAKASVLLLDEFRSGRLGRITLEQPE